jgi:hypothetical protein
MFCETKDRPSYSKVLGFDDSRWSLHHEKMVLSVLLDLMACGIIPKEKLDMEGLIELPKINFLNFSPHSQDPVAKRPRVSFGTSSAASAQISFSSGPNFPRPEWASNLVSLRDDNDLGRAALLEVLLQHQGELGGHELRSEEDDFNVVLWRIASSYLCMEPQQVKAGFQRWLSDNGCRGKGDL